MLSFLFFFHLIYCIFVNFDFKCNMSDFFLFLIHTTKKNSHERTILITIDIEIYIIRDDSHH